MEQNRSDLGAFMSHSTLSPNGVGFLPGAGHRYRPLAGFGNDAA